MWYAKPRGPVMVSCLHQITAENQRRNHMQYGDQKLAMEAKTERGIFCYLRYSKIIAKGEVTGM